MTVKEEHETPEPQADHEKHAKEAGNDPDSEHERQMDFLGPPRDWIERFGRNFLITSHTHLEGGQAREILPWLRISADLDPQRVETYTVAAYWLRDLGKYKEADQFLQEGLRNNPNSYEILFELGRLYRENYHDNDRARNVWEAALRKWMVRESNKKEPDLFKLEEIALNLGRMEEGEGHWQKAIEMLELAKKASPHPEVLQRQIEELRRKLVAPAAG
jgi:tetratricopeptide (TPR) repeat protein